MCNPVCGMMHVKDPLPANERLAYVMGEAGFLSQCYSGFITIYP